VRSHFPAPFFFSDRTGAPARSAIGGAVIDNANIAA